MKEEYDKTTGTSELAYILIDKTQGTAKFIGKTKVVAQAYADKQLGEKKIRIKGIEKETQGPYTNTRVDSTDKNYRVIFLKSGENKNNLE